MCSAGAGAALPAETATNLPSSHAVSLWRAAGERSCNMFGDGTILRFV